MAVVLNLSALPISGPVTLRATKGSTERVSNALPENFANATYALATYISHGKRITAHGPGSLAHARLSISNRVMR
jgi:hypothetical protein